MQLIVAVLCFAAAASAASIVPLDSTLVKSDRVGSNFAYSIQENRGYAAVHPLGVVATPEVKTVGDAVHTYPVKEVVPTTYVHSVPQVAAKTYVPAVYPSYQHAVVSPTYHQAYVAPTYQHAVVAPGHVYPATYQTYPYSYPLTYNFVKTDKI